MLCKVKRCKKCDGGEHTFIVSRWHMMGELQAAAGFTCQHCLLAVDGKHDIEKMREAVHESKEADRESKGSAS